MGYSSCLKCWSEGEYSYADNKVIFPDTKAPLRTDEEFRNKADDSHHKGTSVLENIKDIDMIKDFPIGDVLHLIDLGIVKKFLKGWMDGSLQNMDAKWSAREILEVSDFLVSCKMPKEIKRKVRSLKEISFWKGTEFRTFLLYVSIVVVNRFFEKKVILDHFLHFYCAIVICSRHDQCDENYNIARSLISDFHKGVKMIYGQHMFSSNMHSLCHLVDDVQRFGPLDTFDAYPFESKLFQLKRLIRSGNLPLAQASNRINEMQNSLPKSSNPAQFTILLKKPMKFRPLCDDEMKLNYTELNFYSKITLNDFCFDAEFDTDRWMMNNDFTIVCLEFISLNIVDKTVSFFGYPLIDLKDYFSQPIRSSSLQIFASNLEKGPMTMYEMCEIRSKMVKVDCVDPNLPKSVFIPLLHTINSIKNTQYTINV